MKQVSVKAAYIDDVVLPGIFSGAALDNPAVYGGPNEACALAARHAITAAPGNELVAADWSSIEGRILAWIADEAWKLEAYRAQDNRTGHDGYKLLYSQFFGTPVEEVTDTERQVGKVVDLSCGYGGGVGAFVVMAAGYGINLDVLSDIVLPRSTPEQLAAAERAWRRAFLSGEDYLLEPRVYMACDVLKQVYRKTNGSINRLRYAIDEAVKTCVGGSTDSFSAGKCRIWCTKTWLVIRLPSGRRLLYAAPKLETGIGKDPDNGAAVKSQYVTYATARGKTWKREKAWSGLFLENIVQAIQNDILRIALINVDADTRCTPAVAAYLDKLPFEEHTAIVLHVHDEIVLDVPQGSYSLDRLIEAMATPPDWAKGLPLAAAGWVHTRYGKR